MRLQQDSHAPTHPDRPLAIATAPIGLEASSADEIISRATEAAREMLGMDMAYVADIRGGLQDYRTLSGDGESFGAAVGSPIPLAGTYCEAMLDGRLPNVVPDSRTEPVVCNLPLTTSAEIGSYIGVPVMLSTGETYGTFCCVSHDPNPDLRDRDVQFMRVLARLIGDQLQRGKCEEAARRLAVRAGNVTALLAALEARDGYTQAHSEAVVELALTVARRLGMSAEELADLESAAVLHDIGKIGISDAILRKPGSLDDEEWDAMRRHSEIGADIVASMEPLAHLAPAIRAEHERWDGTGYPDGLKGEEIPLASRIVFVCDAYHAMTSDRPYRKALSHEVALAELSRGAGTQFCPATVAAALATITEVAAA